MNGYILYDTTIPGTPLAGHVIIYMKPDGKMYSKNCTGKEVMLKEEYAKLLEQSFRFDNGI